MSTEIGREYTAFIPSLSDDANIQEAFRMYHFGTQDGSEPAPGDVLTSGIESHLASLKNDIDNLASGTDVISDLVDATELDSVVTSGTYRRASSPLSGKNYPELSAGLLSVTATSGNAIYQFYQTIGGSSGTNKIFWRGRDAANAWSNWAEASKAGHNHDTLYYTETEIDEKIDPQSALTANSVVVTDANKKITSSSIISSTELGYLNEVTSNIQDQLNDRYTKSESARVFVQQTQPTGASTGDIWLW
jgi:hypothetical protein